MGTYVPSEPEIRLMKEECCGAGTRTPISRSRAARISIIRPRREVSSIATQATEHPTPQEPSRVRGETRARVAKLVERGFATGQIARHLGVSPAAVSYHLR